MFSGNFLEIYICIEQIDDKIMLDAPGKKLDPMMSHLSFTTER
jgi:hypothetical protein